VSTQSPERTREHAASFDHTDPQTCAHLHDVFAAMREDSAVVHSDRFGGFWAVTRYEELVRVARDTKTFTSTQGVSIPDFGNAAPPVPLASDPPEHTGYRHFLAPRFRKAEVAHLEPVLRGIVVGCLDAVRGLGACDLVPALTEPVPAIAIATLLGLPESDWDTFRHWAMMMHHAAYAEDPAELAAAGEGLGTYLAAALQARQGAPDDGGVLHQLANGRLDDGELPFERALGMAILLLLAGHETTAGIAGSLLHRLMADDALRARLLADPALVPAFVDEGLRHESPTVGMARTATRPVEIDGTRIEAGDKVMLLFSSANHDARVYPDPDVFEVGRAGRSHLAFGFGPHRCLGEHLALLELRIVVEEVLRVLPDVQLLPGTEISYTPGVARGPVSLPVRFTPSTP
jgi:cytochrome P450